MFWQFGFSANKVLSILSNAASAPAASVIVIVFICRAFRLLSALFGFGIFVVSVLAASFPPVP
jgi:hypothetical protein